MIFDIDRPNLVHTRLDSATMSALSTWVDHGSVAPCTIPCRPKRSPSAWPHRRRRPVRRESPAPHCTLLPHRCGEPRRDAAIDQHEHQVALTRFSPRSIARPRPCRHCATFAAIRHVAPAQFSWLDLTAEASAVRPPNSGNLPQISDRSGRRWRQTGPMPRTSKHRQGWAAREMTGEEPLIAVSCHVPMRDPG